MKPPIMISILFLVALGVFLLIPSSCEKEPKSTPEPPKADTIFFAIEGVEMSNGHITFLGYNKVKFEGNFSKLQASTFKIVDYGYVISSKTNQPTISNNEGVSQEGIRTTIGTFESIISNLTENNTYYARVYLKREVFSTGDIEYGYHPFSISFKTKAGTPPPVNNLDTKNITTSNFQLNALIEDENQLNISQYGHVWSTVSPIPSLNNYEGMTDFELSETVYSHQFSSEVSNLLPNTNYNVRAYATNQFGTGYSSVITVRTAEVGGYVCINGICQYVDTGAEYNTLPTCRNDCCGAFLSPGISRRFQCHNLGANSSADPYSPTWEIVGGYWQWGRKEQVATGPSGPAISQANDGTILNWNNIETTDEYWLKNNDPCPEGYRIPDAIMWGNVIANNTKTWVGTWTCNTTNYSSGCLFGDNLFLPAVGSRNENTGMLESRGCIGWYWSTVKNNLSGIWSLRIDNFEASMVGLTDTNLGFRGYSIRCYKE